MRIESSGKPDAWKFARPVWGWGRGETPRPTPHWFPSACSFFIDFQHAFDRGDTNVAAFHLHQATERFFNAIVLTFTRYKPKTHDIEKLDHQASDLHPEFFKVFPRATEQQKHCFDLLKNAYIEVYSWNPRFRANFGGGRGDRSGSPPLRTAV